MSSWIFVDLESFVDKISSVLEKFSIYHTSLDELKFAARTQTGLAKIIFLNGHKGINYLKSQMKHVGEKDLIYLVIDSPSLHTGMQKEIDNLLINTNRIKGIIEKNQGIGFSVAQLRGIKERSDLLFEGESDKEYFKDFEQQIEDVSQELSAQLQEVKRLHHSLVPQREVRFGNLKTVCKYAVGDSKHSEFWDVVRRQNHQLTILLSTESSKDLMEVFDHLIAFLDQNEYEIRDIKAFHKYLKEKLRDSFSLFMMLTSWKGPSVFIIDGPLLAFINGQSVTCSAKFGELNQIQLRERDRFFIISSGMMKNYAFDFKDHELLQMLKRKWKLPTHEFLQHIFFSAKINKEGQFHYHDGTCLILEIVEEKRAVS